MAGPKRGTTPERSSGKTRKDRQRLEFIEFRLYWEGRINRQDLAGSFGISIPQASLDLKRYQELAPANMTYDLSRKAYVASKRFRPRLTEPDANTYLSQLRLLGLGALPEHGRFFGRVPTFELLPELGRPVDRDILRRVVRTILAGRKLRIRYQAMTNPDPTDRWVHPCALAHDGFRWHLRAYCHLREAYRDFILGKIIAVTAEADEERDIPADANWEEFVPVQVCARQDPEENRKLAVERDYGMTHGRCEVKVRRSLLPYFLAANGIDAPFEWEGSPAPPPIQVLNRDEIMAELAARRAKEKG